jgi:hypothetical protein
MFKRSVLAAREGAQVCGAAFDGSLLPLFKKNSEKNSPSPELNAGDFVLESMERTLSACRNLLRFWLGRRLYPSRYVHLLV